MMDSAPVEVVPEPDGQKTVMESQLSQRVGFTSEEFKIELNGLPKFFNAGGAKKLLKKLKLDYHKLKPCGPNANYMFVNFKNEEERERAISLLDGYQLKGKKLKAFKARAARDPMVKAEATKAIVEAENPLSIREQLFSALCPLAHLPYEEQLAEKLRHVEEVMSKLRSETLVHLGFARDLLASTDMALNEENVASVSPFVPSPIIDGYRNKCEFSVGHHPETKEVTVGFRLASYKKGCIAVVGVDELPMVSQKMKLVARHFRDFVLSSGLEPFNSVSQQGYWKQLTVRTSTIERANLLVVAIIHPQDMNPEQKDKLRKDFLTHMELLSEDCKVTSLHIQFFGRKEKGQAEPPIEHLSGAEHVRERLFSLEFLISPRAFFQINTAAAEKLYETAGNVAHLDQNTVLLDVCCGTGTIGLCLANRCKEVIGVEIIEDAVKDAQRNAASNNINNAKFLAGRAEFILPDVLRSLPSDCSTVAIVDPPRAGLHPKAVHALRNSDKIQSLVYVSCDAKAAMNSLVGLVRPTSNAFPGDPFVPREVVPVDLFPHTSHFELVIFFQRIPLKKLLASK